MKKISLFIFSTLLIVAMTTAYKNPVREQLLVSIARNNADRTVIAVAPKDAINTGADQTEKYVPYLKGRRVAILANQTSILGRRHMVDSLQSLGVNIAKVFGPEHGLGDRTLLHICKAHKTHRTEANLAKELQLPTHSTTTPTETNNILSYRFDEKCE
jgi:uncharacterized protein YbbC (DUF1343 family)